MGAIKAGVTIVSFDEKDDVDALDAALATSGAKGLIFSPDTATGENETRLSFLQKLMPELSSMSRGEELSLKKYPSLEMLVQTGHTGLRGVNKFRDVAVYANPRLSSRQIPANDSDALTHLALKGGREAGSFTSGELVTKSNELWSQYLQASEDSVHPVFMTADLETPFGFASFLGCSTNFKKMFIPGSFNMSAMLKKLPRQQSSFVVCDEEFYALQVPGAKAAEYQEMCDSVKGALVASDSTGAAGSSDLFTQARANKVNKYTL